MIAVSLSLSHRKGFSVSLGSSGIGRLRLASRLDSCWLLFEYRSFRVPRLHQSDNLPEMLDDRDLDLLERQTPDVEHRHRSPTTDLAVRSDQPLARDRPARQGFEDFDEDQVGRLDDIGKD